MVGSAVGPAMAWKPDELPKERVPRGRKLGYSDAYTQGYGPAGPYERDYGFVSNMAQGGIVGMQQGGPVGGENEKTVTSDAIAALQGAHPAPEIALAKYVQTFGEDALKELVASVRRGDQQMNASGATGEVYGPGGGDMVPAQNASNGQDIMLEDGEYVLPKEMAQDMGYEELDQAREQYV